MNLAFPFSLQHYLSNHLLFKVQYEILACERHNDHLNGSRHPVALIGERVHMTAINAFAKSQFFCFLRALPGGSYLSPMPLVLVQARFQERFSRSTAEIILFARSFLVTRGWTFLSAEGSQLSFRRSTSDVFAVHVTR